MKFYNTKNRSEQVSLQQAVLHSLAEDGGLYMPETIPTLPSSFFENLPGKSFQEMAVEVAEPFLEADLSKELIKKMVEQTLTFDAPLVKIKEGVYALELFHGPTLAFKDVGARFMAQLLQYFAKRVKQEVTVLAATSGDTGSAVANGFFNVPHVRVVVLYPSGKVSNLQEKQFTTLGNNITAIEVEGTFDDCQRLVKTAFQDASLRDHYFLTSANSINIARLLPQMFYYFYAWSRLPNKEQVVFSVPSGNFGNLTAGLLAQRMGLPIQQFIASTNRNNAVPSYLHTGIFTPHASHTTLSNAMDVGNPSNFSRMLDLFDSDWKRMIEKVIGYEFSDENTSNIMAHVFNQYHYMLDPHGAVGYLGLESFLKNNPTFTGVFLETAHPAKFLEVVEASIHSTVVVPDALQQFIRREKKSIRCSHTYEEFKKILLANT